MRSALIVSKEVSVIGVRGGRAWYDRKVVKSASYRNVGRTEQR